MKKYNRENIIRIDTYIEEYDKFSDSFSKEFSINEIDIQILKIIFDNNSYDEELFLSYEIDNVKSEMINELLVVPIFFDFEKFEYFLQRYGEYK
ncbi:hypothetical protein IWX84_001087 [Flavobacterium sp. CG_9.10]|uniref:DUF7683 domain-containing protein n=1 Tax=Flavobacterium sp. CG_9.10 TaxID=2787729 RepID=UPI0018CACE05|nr:hypothetical protein [Flavobacterium sp. CG_9.10]MBG6110222.1 hypothetical protein [Flavobacterium sp. CG_9.10]